MSETLKLINTMGEALAEIRNQADEIAKLKALLTEIAGVAHHGGLIGYDGESGAITQVRKLTVSHWDKTECTRLQSEVAK